MLLCVIDSRKRGLKIFSKVYLLHPHSNALSVLKVVCLSHTSIRYVSSSDLAVETQQIWHHLQIIGCPKRAYPSFCLVLSHLVRPLFIENDHHCHALFADRLLCNCYIPREHMLGSHAIDSCIRNFVCKVLTVSHHSQTTRPRPHPGIKTIL